MKLKSFILASVVTVVSTSILNAADAPAEKTTPAAARKDDAKLAPAVPDSTRKPSLVTSTITVAGQPVRVS